MSKLARMRAARSSIAPCVATVMSLAVVCAGSEVRDARPQSALQARVADGGGGEGRAGMARDNRAAGPILRR